jgi:hypothetical protein
VAAAVAFFASAWAAAGAAAPAGVSATARVASVVSTASGGRMSAGAAIARFSGDSLMHRRFAGSSPDSKPINWVTRDKRDSTALIIIVVSADPISLT